MVYGDIWNNFGHRRYGGNSCFIILISSTVKDAWIDREIDRFEYLSIYYIEMYIFI